MIDIDLNFLQNIVEVLWDGCMLISQEGNIMYINDNCSHLFGYDQNDLVGEKVNVLVPDHVKSKHTEYLQRFDDKLNYVMGKNRYVHGICKNGSKIPLEIRLSTVVLDGIPQILAIFRNKSQDVEMIAELESAKKKLQETLDAQTYFFANLSHELRTPINGIIGMVGLIENASSHEERVEYLKDLSESSNMLSSLVNNILDYSLLEKGQIQLHRNKINIVAFMTQIRRYFEIISKEKNVEFEIHIDNVPETVTIDEVRIRQVINNLIGNSFKFTEKGFVRLRVSTNNDVLVFCVSDTGIGIKAEQQARMFRPFVQASPSISQKYGGTGLGLAISKGLVQNMGGEISMSSAENQGTTTNFTIPFERIQNVSLVQTVLENEDNKVVVIVDDHLVNQFVLRKYIEKMLHCHIIVCNNGREAFDILAQDQNYNPRIIFMDIHMPHMGGYECTKQLRAAGITSPIIAITADCLTEDILLQKECGMNDFLLKPFQFDDFKKILSKWNIH